MARARINCAMLCDKPHQIDAAAKIAMPTTKMRRRPNRSPAAPPVKTNADRQSVYALTSHWITATDVARSVSIAGSATLTTDSSIKAMLEPRIVTANTHGLVLAALLRAATVARIAASSHGCALGLIIDSGPVLGGRRGGAPLSQARPAVLYELP